MELNDILKIALKGGASDIHLKSGLPPMFRVDGALVPLKNGERLMPEDIQSMAFGIMNPVQKERFEETREIDLAHGIAGLGRFRVNCFQQRGTVGIVFRVIPFGVKSIENLHLPKIIQSIAMENRGLILVTGTTGSGKSTTLASMIEYINTNRTCHIMTIEDPIEFLIRDRRSIVNQREIGFEHRREVLARMKELCQERGLHLTIIIPWYRRYSDHVVPTRMLARELDLVSVDLPRALEGYSEERRDYFSDPVHPNEQGHALIAEEIIEVAREQWKQPLPDS